MASDALRNTYGYSPTVVKDLVDSVRNMYASAPGASIDDFTVHELPRLEQPHDEPRRASQGVAEDSSLCLNITHVSLGASNMHHAYRQYL
jgi:hypothetical protein